MIMDTKRYMLNRESVDIDSFISSKKMDGCEFVGLEEIGDNCFIVFNEPDDNVSQTGKAKRVYE